MIEGEFTDRQNCVLRHCFVITVRNKFCIPFLKLYSFYVSITHVIAKN